MIAASNDARAAFQSPAFTAAVPFVTSSLVDVATGPSVGPGFAVEGGGVSIDRFPEARELRVIVQVRKLGAGRATRTRRFTQQTLPADLAGHIPCPAAACRNGGLRHARLYLMVVDTLSRKEANTRTVIHCQSVEADAPGGTASGLCPNVFSVSISATYRA